MSYKIQHHIRYSKLKQMLLNRKKKGKSKSKKKGVGISKGVGKNKGVGIKRLKTVRNKHKKIKS